MKLVACLETKVWMPLIIQNSLVLKYIAYSDLKGIGDLTEKMIRVVAKEATGSAIITTMETSTLSPNSNGFP